VISQIWEATTAKRMYKDGYHYYIVLMQYDRIVIDRIVAQ